MADFHNIIGKSPSMRGVYQMLERVVQARDVSVLICGETGTGKEVVARAIHDLSTDGNELLVEVNCAGIPEGLLESELFGHVRGAFTGADRNRRGLVELAKGGSLLLDEIGEMSLPLQAKLLKVLEDKAYRPLGGEKEVRVAVRILACTNRDLSEAIAEGRFREDLYYRLDEFRIDLPPLRDRGDDVILLAEAFIEEFAGQFDSVPRTLSANAKALLRQYRWPGNVRELRNAIKRAMIMHDAPELSPEMISVSVRSTESLARQVHSRAPARGQLLVDIPESGATLEEVERCAIARTLELSQGNKSQAARMLQISYPRLLRKLDKYNLRQ